MGCWLLQPRSAARPSVSVLTALRLVFLRLAASLPNLCWLCPQLVEAGGKARFDLRSRETVLIHHVFGGYTRNQVACRRCALGPAGLWTGWLMVLLVLG